MRFFIALRLRNAAELEARVAKGEVISRAEMADRYWPTKADYRRIAAWAQAQGLSTGSDDPSRLSVDVTGRVDQVEQALATHFARVSARGREWSSAVTAPSLPSEIAGAVLGIHGLQPDVQLDPLASKVRPQVGSGFTPAQITFAYNKGGVSANGTGQTIAIYAAAYPAQSDVVGFWGQYNIAGDWKRIQFVDVDGGPNSATTSPTAAEIDEVTLDVEWASAMAPGAIIRIYAVPKSTAPALQDALRQIAADRNTDPTLNQLSISFGNLESALDSDYLLIGAQEMVNLASAGIAVLCASGDLGAGATYPASDPSVTAIGGTTLHTDYSGNVTSESAWYDTGCGPSATFARPAWQAGALAAFPTRRLIPDVCVVGDPQTGVLIYIGGQSLIAGGTSASAPIWAGFTAVINSARQNAGRAPVGFLNPALYAVANTNSFRDITQGYVSPYSAGAGFDLVTGLGVPNVYALTTSLPDPSAAPIVTTSFVSRFTTLGQPTAIAAAASGMAPLAYRWQRQANGAGAFSDLADGANYAGTATATLFLNNCSYAMNQDNYRCVVSNGAGVATSSNVTLQVNGVGTSTVAGWPELAGAVDGIGWAARMSYPGSVRIDTAGNLYVTDADNNVIRKITPSGTVTTVAGALGQAGSVDGVGGDARFSDPGGLAIDPSGIIYVADSGNDTVRKIALDGTVTTIAGTAGIRGTADGQGSAAQFYELENIAIGPDGMLYVVDGGANTVRSVSPAGLVTTIAGFPMVSGTTDGNGSAARFNFPTGLAVDRTGNVYVADHGNGSVRKITPQGDVSTMSQNLVLTPSGVAVDAVGNVFVTEDKNCQIRQFAPNGTVTVICGRTTAGAVDSDAADALLNYPADLTVDPSGILFVADSGNNTVRKIILGTLTGPTVTRQPASQTISAGQNTQLAVTTTGTAPITFQWQMTPPGGGVPIAITDGPGYSGTTTSTLTLISPSVAMNGATYSCVIKNNQGSTTSASVSVTVNGPPVVIAPAQSPTYTQGSQLVLNAPVSTNATSYIWSFNGQPIAGQTRAQLSLPSFAATNVGTYTVAASNSFGTVTATVATPRLATAWLANLSARAAVSVGNDLVTGFVVSGVQSKMLLLRGAGPSLQSFGVSNALGRLKISLYDSTGTSILTNSGWGGSSSLAAVFSQVGAFPWPAGSLDAALTRSVSAGAFTTTLSALNGSSGVALNEIYDSDLGVPSSRLTNLSTRSQVGADSSVLVGGFVIAGAGFEHVLLRGIGPTLGAFGVANPLAHPVLTLYNASGTVLAANSGWGGDPALAAAFASVGAFLLPGDSADAALLISLSPGNYSAQISGQDGTQGAALIEIYEISP